MRPSLNRTVPGSLASGAPHARRLRRGVPQNPPADVPGEGPTYGSTIRNGGSPGYPHDRETRCRNREVVRFLAVLSERVAAPVNQVGSRI